MPSVRFIRFAKITVLIADTWTLAYLALVFGWQTFIFLRDGSWRALPLSLVFRAPYNEGEVYSTSSIGRMSESWTSTDAFLEVPIITLLLLAAAFLTGFYLWISSLEKELAKTQIR